MLTRRSALIAGSAAAFLGSGSSARSNSRKSEVDAVIHDGVYPGWPWVAAGRDGTLFCVFREGTAHDFSETGRVMLSTSKDGGKKWTNAATIIDEPGVDDRNAAIVELPSRNLLLTFNTYTRSRESQAVVSKSSDGGRSWSRPKPLDLPNTRTKAAAYVASNGNLILPYYIAPGNGAVAGVSTDEGETWKTYRVPDTDGFVGDEWDLVETEPGRLVGILRNNRPKSDGVFWKTESRDGGKTWEVPRPTNVQSLRHASPAQITLQGKTPTLVYSDRRMVSVSAVKTSDPNFIQWDIESRLPCYVYRPDESPIPDGSYPVSAPINASRRIIVDYEIRENSKRIAAYFVDFPKNW